MNIQLQGHIVGVKKFNGQIEGKSFDYCRLIVATPLDSSQGNALGSSTTEYDFGGSANFEQFRNAQFPIEANLNVGNRYYGQNPKTESHRFSTREERLIECRKSMLSSPYQQGTFCISLLKRATSDIPN
ncbi:phage associated protein [Neisseria meningitidis]|nr:phage associated protein [Neisseria meningitidis]